MRVKTKKGIIKNDRVLYFDVTYQRIILDIQKFPFIHKLYRKDQKHNQYYYGIELTKIKGGK